jgi:hypothetical protein
MPGRARYDGPHLEVRVFHPETNELLDTVTRGGLLTANAPAAIRDDLLSREDWTEVKDPAGPSSSSKKED